MIHSTDVVASRWILPITSDPINGGWVRYSKNQILEVGIGAAPQGATDLGDVAILPKLVNAHTHLEFSDLELPIGHSGIPLYEWIVQVIAARSKSTPAAATSAIAKGLDESSRAGVRLIGDIATPPCQYEVDPEIDVIAFAEIIGLSEERYRNRLQAAVDHHRSVPHAGWSPHAPYSTSWQAIEEAVSLSRKSGRPLAMHVAEAPSERELLVGGGGPFADVLRMLGVWQDERFPWGNEPFLQLIDCLALSSRGLIIHGNDLRTHEIARIARYPSLSVVYCPRTHDFFGYPRHPVGEILEAGIRVALGTDSRASNPDLDLWGEVQFLLKHRPDIARGDVLRMATAGGADALGRPDLGRIEPQSSSGLGYVATSASDVDQLYADLAANPFQRL